MSAEAITQLEFHIAECEDCGEFVEQKRRTFKEMAGQSSAVAYIQDDVPTPEPILEVPRQNAAQALIRALKEKAESPGNAVVLETTREQPAPKRIQWKTFIYSAALGLVLLAMSHFTANPTALFGERAAEKSLPAAAPVNEDSVKPENTVRDPFIQEPAPDLTAELPNASPPIAESEPGPKISKTSTPLPPKIAVASRPAIRRSPRTARPQTSTPARSGNSIRVYDENGRPISGA